MKPKISNRTNPNARIYSFQLCCLIQIKCFFILNQSVWDELTATSSNLVSVQGSRRHSNSSKTNLIVPGLLGQEGSVSGRLKEDIDQSWINWKPDSISIGSVRTFVTIFGILGVSYNFGLSVTSIIHLDITGANALISMIHSIHNQQDWRSYICA